MSRTLQQIESRLNSAVDAADRLTALIALATAVLHADTARAAALAEEARHLAAENECPSELAQSLHILGLCNARLCRYGDAEESYAEASRIFREIGDRAGVGAVLTNSGILECFRGNYTAALERYQESLAIFEELGETRRIAIALLNMGTTYSDLHRYDDALSCLDRTLVAALELGDDAFTANIIGELGRIHANRGDWSRALERYGDSLALSERAGQKHLAANTCNDIGTTLVRLGDYAEALVHFKRSLEMSESLGNRRGMSLALNNIGDLKRHIGDVSAALRYFDESLRIREELGNARDIAATLDHVARAHVELGQLDEARTCALRCVELCARDGEDRGLAAALRRLGEVDARRGDHESALVHLREAHRIFESIGYREGESDALFAIGESELAAVENRRGGMRAGASSSDARATLERAREMAEALGSRPLLARIHAALAREAKRRGDLAAAIEHVEESHRLEREIFNEQSEARTRHLAIVLDVERAHRQQELSSKEAEILRLRNEQLEADAEFRKKELVTTALHLTHRSELLRRVQHSLRDMRNDGRLERSSLSALAGEISSALDGEQAWQTFERQFHQVHAGYLEQLATRYPTLTPTELKVCALIKINLSTKEIAQILNTEPRSIEKYRQRIRAKIGLSQEEGLLTALLGVGGTEGE